MNEPDIEEIIRVFAFRSLARPNMPENFVEYATLAKRFGLQALGALRDTGGDEIRTSEEVGEQIANELRDRGVLEPKAIPYGATVYRFDQATYADLRGDILRNSQIYQDSREVDGYFNAVFEGFKRVNTESKTGTYSRSELNAVDWKQVTSRFATSGTKEIEVKIVELATAIQNSDLTDRQKKNLIARTRAVQELLDAPEPAWRSIVELLNDKNLCAFLNCLALLQIILGSI